MSKSVRLPNGREWKTQLAAREHFKQMLARYSTGAQVTNVDDHDDLSALLAVYDRGLALKGETKVGPGIHHFSRDTNVTDGWDSDSFHVHRVDGTMIDFSYIKAVQYASRRKPP